MVEFPLQWGINLGQKLLDTPTRVPMPSIKCLQRSVPRAPCHHAPLSPTQTPLAGHAWRPCWKAQRCWPCSSCQPLLDPLLVPRISTWATFSSPGPHQELAASQLPPLSSLPLPLRFSCCVLLETMGQTASLLDRQTRCPKTRHRRTKWQPAFWMKLHRTKSRFQLTQSTRPFVAPQNTSLGQQRDCRAPELRTRADSRRVRPDRGCRSVQQRATRRRSMARDNLPITDPFNT